MSQDPLEKWRTIESLCSSPEELASFATKFLKAEEERLTVEVCQSLLNTSFPVPQALKERIDRLELEARPLCTECKKKNPGMRYRLTSLNELEARFVCDECINLLRAKIDQSAPPVKGGSAIELAKKAIGVIFLVVVIYMCLKTMKYF